MTLLPVVDRELRVGSRNRSTYRIRFFGALVPIAFCFFSLWFVPNFGGGGPIPPRDLFLILTWMAFIFVAIAGFTLTCDSISQEKRDATLGLLFLTDLKGYDVVLGKLAVSMLRGVSALIGTIPVLALPMMLGGTDLSEFARTSLALLLTLFFSMTLGLLASAAMRRAWSSFGVCFSIMLVFCAALPLHASLHLYYFRNPWMAHLIELPSPTYALIMSFRSALGLSGFYPSLTVIAVISILALIATMLMTPHVWKDRPATRRVSSILGYLRNLKYGAPQARSRFRRRLLDFNPIYWLSRRERISNLGMLLIVLSAGAIAGWFASRHWNAPWQAQVVIPFLSWTGAGTLIHFAILLRLAVLATERFAEDRKSGALELTLSTPITVRQILAGHWAALLRYFAGPMLIVFCMQALSIFLILNLQVLDNRNPVGVLQLLTEARNHVIYGIEVPGEGFFHLATLIALLLFVGITLNWIALAWLATWLSLRTRTAYGAPIAALIILHAPPWIISGITATTLEELRLVPANEFSEGLLYALLSGFFILIHQVLCIWWSRRKLYKDFRTAATDRYQPLRERRSWWRFLISPREKRALHRVTVPAQG